MPPSKRHLALPSLALCLLASACATSGALATDTQSGPARARVTLAPLPSETTVRIVPYAVEPMLPSADRLSQLIARRLGERATVDVRFCVSPAGKLVSAELARRSQLPAFDQAVMTDIVGWQFSASPGPATLRSCQTATIIYRVSPRG